MDNSTMRKLSGCVDDKRRLVLFIYLLGRDHLPLGTIEEILDTCDKQYSFGTYTNGFLANYAKVAAERLENPLCLNPVSQPSPPVTK